MTLKRSNTILVQKCHTTYKADCIIIGWHFHYYCSIEQTTLLHFKLIMSR